MGCLGVHFALSEQEIATLRAIEDEDERLGYFQETMEEDFFDNHPDQIVQSDKAWDAIHRVLADGELTWDGGDYPLNHVVLAGELLYTEDDYIMTLKSPAQVWDIAAALPTVTEANFRKRYFELDEDEYGFELTDDDLEYTWGHFQEVREFSIRAAKAGKYVLFTADQ